MLKLCKNLLTGKRGIMYYWGMKMKNSSRGENDFTGMYYPVIDLRP